MVSTTCDRAISESLSAGVALLKFISANDVGKTGSHQYGYYLPKGAWECFSPNEPQSGINADHKVKIRWQDGRVTNSRVVWYGRGTRSEYRLTRFGKEFPWLQPDSIGSLLVLCIYGHSQFSGFVLDTEDEIADYCAALGIDFTGPWSVYRKEEMRTEESAEDCLARKFREFCIETTVFPSTAELSKFTQTSVLDCVANFAASASDDQLIRLVNEEYQLFRLLERNICQHEIARLFRSVDDFISTAAKIMNRRKSRAGRSFENHVEWILKARDIPHTMRPNVDGRPDIIVPSESAYKDSSFPRGSLCHIALKTTCKERWQQVLNEAKRAGHRYLITLQRGLSDSQFNQMKNAGLTIVVPKAIQNQYSMQVRKELLTLEHLLSAELPMRIRKK